MVTASTPGLDPTILDYLRQNQLLREGHFAFRSGHHAAALIDRDLLLADAEAASKMGYAISRQHFLEKVDTVASPSIWGAGLAQWVAYFLQPRARVVYATPKPDGTRAIAERLHPLIDGKRVLLVDNVVISGETLTWLNAEVGRLGGTVVGIASLWDISPTFNEGDASSLFNSRFPAWTAAECPLCAAGDRDIEHVGY
jgi:orotate phosphoribosyltransferase